ncbi:MAG: histidine kinase dimerization/phosphoacceptor domain -containing protein [Luteibaculaceae bacterium]
MLSKVLAISTIFMQQVNYGDILKFISKDLIVCNGEGNVLHHNLSLDNEFYHYNFQKEPHLKNLNISDLLLIALLKNIRDLPEGSTVKISHIEPYLIEVSKINQEQFLIALDTSSRIFELTQLRSHAFKNVEETFSCFSYYVTVIDSKKRLDYISERISKVYNCSSSAFIEECNNGTFYDRIHPDDVFKINQLNKNIEFFNNKVSESYRVKINGATDYQWFEEVLTPVKQDSNSNSFSYYGIVRNVNSRIDIPKMVASSNIKYSNQPEAVNKLLLLCLENFEAERAYIFKLINDTETELLNAVQIYEAVAEGVAPQINNRELQNLPVEQLFPELIKILKTGNTFISSNIQQENSTLSYLGDILVREKIRTVALAPIFKNKELWGFVGVDIAVEKQRFSFSDNISLEIIAGRLAEVLFNANLSLTVLGQAQVDSTLSYKQHLSQNWFEAYSQSLYLMWVCDVKGNLLWFNNKYESEVNLQFNFKPEKQKKETLLSERYYSENFARENIKVLEQKIVNAKGQLKFYDIQLQPYYVDSEIKGYSAIGHEVTIKKLAENRIKQQAAKMRTVFDSTDLLLIVTINNECRVTGYNQVLYEFFKDNFRAEIQIGEKLLGFLEKFVKKDSYAKLEPILAREILEYHSGITVTIENSDKKTFWFEAIVNPVNSDFQNNEIVVMLIDVSRQKNVEEKIKVSLKEKEVLLQEVHHRVKNNMQIISSMLNLQINFVEDPELTRVLRESQGRIQSMAQIHENLYKNNNFETVNFAQYIKELSQSVYSMQALGSNSIQFDYNLEPIEIDLERAVPCGLIVNEILTNAIKHAFTKNTPTNPKITLTLSQAKEKVLLIIHDNGKGIPEAFRKENSETLGMQLIYTLVEQIDANLRIETNRGTVFYIDFNFNQ